MSDGATVYVVDDDDAVRTTIARSLEYHDYRVQTFNSGQAFLEALTPDCYGCVILDIAMPGMSGLEVQSILMLREHLIPIIFITGHGDVPTSVRALKSGALEFLEKPYCPDVLLLKVEEALTKDRTRRQNDLYARDIISNYETLTKRESDVMAALVAGMADKSNKHIAIKIGISHRTVEEYRARIMKKMEASSVTHLVEMAKICGIYQAQGD